ncbi:HET-domain-containing protein [Zalerion maritima]|uniref:HET-domain-containing protein n=1 Tax=Zalerion maritima TaxID=339359 RepID=A0AAD5WSS8_9PEZI|nr:HET-domain-containing protein [Zalerion maritima]
MQRRFYSPQTTVDEWPAGQGQNWARHSLSRPKTIATDFPLFEDTGPLKEGRLAPDAPKYEYHAVQKNEIRLLILSPGAEHEQIRCSIAHVKFDQDTGCWGQAVSGPPGSRRMEEQNWDYDALSWAWGGESGNQDEWIYILEDRNQHSFKLRSQHLADALRALRHRFQEKMVWVDAICIDQSSNLEKSHQIPMMDKIYGKAANVRVWLGSGGDAAFKFIREEVLPSLNIETVCQRLGASQKLEELSDLMQRPWFSRRWVVQEIALARSAIIHCGSNQMRWKDFAVAVELFVDAEKKTHSPSMAMNQSLLIPNWFDYVSELGAAILVRATSNLFQNSSTMAGIDSRVKLRSLEYLVCQLSAFGVSVAHDTIYAFLAIAKDTNPIATDHLPGPSQDERVAEVARQIVGRSTRFRSRQYKVDYNQPYRSVCQGFVEFAINETVDKTRALDILCRPWAQEEDARRSLGLPSWIPTLAGAGFEMNNHHNSRGSINRGLKLCRRNGSPFVTLPSSNSRHYTAAQDRVVDTRFLTFKKSDGTEHLGSEAWKELEAEHTPGKKPHPDAYMSMFVTGFILDVIEEVEDISKGTISEHWINLAGWEDKNQYPPEEFWRTLVADRGPDGENPPLYYEIACKEALARSRSPRDIETGSIIASPDERNTVVAEFCRRVESVVYNRCLIRTQYLSSQRGPCLGLVSGRRVPGRPSESRAIRSGDLIAILYGCSVPVVLRRVKKSKTQLGLDHAVDQRLYCEVKKKSAAVIQRAWRKYRERQLQKAPTSRSNSPASRTPFPVGNSDFRQSSQKRTARALSPLDREPQQKRSRTSGGPANCPAEETINSTPLASLAKEHNHKLEEDVYYEFWGECYLHGMMDGEALKVQSDDSLPRMDPNMRRNKVFELR